MEEKNKQKDASSHTLPPQSAVVSEHDPWVAIILISVAVIAAVTLACAVYSAVLKRQTDYTQRSRELSEKTRHSGGT